MLNTVQAQDVVDEDGPLALSQHRLDDAVHCFADPLPAWSHGACRWSDSLYARLRGALRGRKGAGGVRLASGSRAPCSMRALELLIAIDTCVEHWEPGGKGNTIDRLHRLASRSWRPQDTAEMDDISSRLERWSLEASELIGDAPVSVALRLPCPSCGSRFAYRRNRGGETLRTDALKVDESGCDCAACGANWPPDQFHWLAKLLDCPTLPTA